MPLIEWMTVRLDVSENEWRRHNKDRKSQRTGCVRPLDTRKRNRTLGLGKTARPSRAHVQAIGLNAETKKLVLRTSLRESLAPMTYLHRIGGG